MSYQTWQEALRALVKANGLEDSELGDISREATRNENCDLFARDLCADCGTKMGAFECPLCSGIRTAR